MGAGVRVVTDNDVIYALGADLSPTELAKEVGCDRCTAANAAKNLGVRLRNGQRRRSGISEIRHVASGMKPVDAVEFLLGIIQDQNPPEAGLWPGIDLSPGERAVFAVIWAKGGKIATRRAIEVALFPDPDSTPVSAAKILDITIFRLRKKIAGTGAHIRTMRGEGFYLERDPGTVFPWET